MKPSTRNLIRLIVVIIMGISIPLLVYLLIIFNTAVRPLWVIAGKLKDEGNYMVYLPDGLEAGKQYPLVFALSPTADAVYMISTWAPIAEKHKWIVAASKTFQNYQEIGPALAEVNTELDGVESKYSINTNQVIFTGISGGGTYSYGYVEYYPNRVWAIVINTGRMMLEPDMSSFPNGKLAVLIASPTDFRYQEMQQNRAFLQTQNWKIDWIEFPGGHEMAPTSVYYDAADWLEQYLP